MNKRKRNKRIDIERPTGAVNGANEPLGTYERVASRHASIVGKTGMATIRGSETGISASPNMYSIEVQFDPDLYDTGMRVNYKGRYFDIKEIRHDFANKEYTHLVCETGANNG